jgi:hypothetical protein
MARDDWGWKESYLIISTLDVTACVTGTVWPVAGSVMRMFMLCVAEDPRYVPSAPR